MMKWWVNWHLYKVLLIQSQSLWHVLVRWKGLSCSLSRICDYLDILIKERNNEKSHIRINNEKTFLLMHEIVWCTNLDSFVSARDFGTCINQSDGLPNSCLVQIVNWCKNMIKEFEEMMFRAADENPHVSYNPYPYHIKKKE